MRDKRGYRYRLAGQDDGDSGDTGEVGKRRNKYWYIDAKDRGREMSIEMLPMRNAGENRRNDGQEGESNPRAALLVPAMRGRGQSPRRSLSHQSP